MKKSIDATAVLHEHELKSTPIRVAILETLDAIGRPLTAEELIKKLKKRGGDIATIYRALNSFAELGIVSELTLSSQFHHYHLTYDNTHVHYVLCNRCGVVESIDFCVRNIEVNAAQKSRLFKRISNHHISFKGTCRKCVRAVR